MSASNADNLIVYEMALLQFCPDPTSEERFNIGVIAVDPETNQFEYRITSRYGRLSAAYPDLDGRAFRNIASGIRQRCSNLARDLVKGQLLMFDTPNLALLAERIVSSGSATFAWSTTRYGTCHDLRMRVEEVFNEYIGGLEETSQRDRIDEARLWNIIAGHPRVGAIAHKINNPVSLETKRLDHEFPKSWMNGTLQVAEPISLDFQRPLDIVERAVRWHGLMRLLVTETEYKFRFTALVTDKPGGIHGEKHEQATDILRETPGVRAVINQSGAEQFAEMVEGDLAAN